MVDMMESESVSVVAVTFAVGAVVLLIVLMCGFIKKEEDKKEKSEEKEEETKENGHIKQKKPAANKKQRSFDRKEPKVTFTHPWLATSLKGHSSQVLGFDFSPNGKYVASCAEDRTVLIWYTKEFNKKEHKSVRANVELDHATNVRFSPDNKAFITTIHNANTVRVFKMGKKSDGSLGNIQAAFDFEKMHTQDLLNIGIASSGRFIMTCTKDTILTVWDLKGEVLATINTNQVNTSYAAVSPCGRFIASSGFTPDVKIWEVCFDKTGNYREISRAFELKGHSAGIYYFSFSGDSSRMATISKDGTWRLWDTDIEYAKGQEPYLLQTGTYTHSGPAIIALSSDGRTIGVAVGTSLYMYEANTARLEQTFTNVHTKPISTLAFDLSGRYLVSSGDKHMHVFHNVVGLRATVVELEQKKQKASSISLKERIQQQMDEAKAILTEIESELKKRNNDKN